MRSLVLAIAVLLTMSGCTKYFTVGENRGYCEEHGCDYSDAGLCGDPYEIYRQRHALGDRPYAGIDCRKGVAAGAAEIYVIEEGR